MGSLSGKDLAAPVTTIKEVRSPLLGPMPPPMVVSTVAVPTVMASAPMELASTPPTSTQIIMPAAPQVTLIPTPTTPSSPSQPTIPPASPLQAALGGHIRRMATSPPQANSRPPLTAAALSMVAGSFSPGRSTPRSLGIEPCAQVTSTSVTASPEPSEPFWRGSGGTPGTPVPPAVWSGVGSLASVGSAPQTRTPSADPLTGARLGAVTTTVTPSQPVGPAWTNIRVGPLPSS